MTNLVFNTSVNINAFFNPASTQTSAQGMVRQMASGSPACLPAGWRPAFRLSVAADDVPAARRRCAAAAIPQARPSFVPDARRTVDSASLKNEHQGTIDLGETATRSSSTSGNLKSLSTTPKPAKPPRVWGDLHVDVDGSKCAFDFWARRRSSTLENGTKITIDTEQYAS